MFLDREEPLFTRVSSSVHEAWQGHRAFPAPCTHRAAGLGLPLVTGWARGCRQLAKEGRAEICVCEAVTSPSSLMMTGVGPPLSTGFESMSFADAAQLHLPLSGRVLISSAVP